MNHEENEIQDRQAEIALLHEELFGPSNTNGAGHHEHRQIEGVADLDDQALIDRAMGASNGQKFRALWSGDASAYASQSEADAALALMLAFWTGRDIVRMEPTLPAVGPDASEVG